MKSAFMGRRVTAGGSMGSPKISTSSSRDQDGNGSPSGTRQGESRVPACAPWCLGGVEGLIPAMGVLAGQDFTFWRGTGGCTEVCAQQVKGLGDCGEGVLLALEFEGDVTLAPCLFHDAGNAGVVEVQGVPATAPKVGLALHENGPGGQLGQPRVGVLKEVAGVH